MNTQTFLNTLKEHQEKNLLFEYSTNKLVGANYHITEVKHITIDSVDCGAQTDAWKETIVQLWESPKELGKRDFMKVGKALQIFDTVGNMKPYVLDAELKIEYGNTSFHATQQFIGDIEIQENDLIVKLSLDQVRCKANDKCGIPEKKLETIMASCEPTSGCC